MSGEKWTKTPWRIEGDAVKTAISAGAKHIAMVNYFDCGPGDPRSIQKEEHESNARIISVAPKMYKALKELWLLHVNEVWTKDAWESAFAEVEEILKSARGEL